MCARSAPHIVSMCCIVPVLFPRMESRKLKDCSPLLAQGVGIGMCTPEVNVRYPVEFLGHAVPSSRPQDYLWLRSWPPADCHHYHSAARLVFGGLMCTYLAFPQWKCFTKSHLAPVCGSMEKQTVHRCCQWHWDVGLFIVTNLI